MLALFNRNEFATALEKSKTSLPVYRKAVATIRDQLKTHFKAGADIEELIHGRAQAVDYLLQGVWEQFFARNNEQIALVAVGGYGRGELHPGSDIDLLILLKEDDHGVFQSEIEGFITFSWDVGLEISHSVRSLRECSEEAAKDITIITNLMEARLLCGPASLLEAMSAAIAPEKIWPSKAFFEAKWQEQINRHNKFHETIYNLEPNIKESPGTLRDIQTIQWVTMRHFRDTTLHDLVKRDFLTEAEFQTLISARNFLWKVRFALHIITNRREDRLLFDYQRTVAELLNYEDERAPSALDTDAGEHWSRAADGHRLGVELFMKSYYRTVMEISQLNAMLLQLGLEGILHADDSEVPVPLNRRFQARKGFIELKDDSIFERYPFALLEVFLLLQQHPELNGVRASTIRQIRNHRYLIDDSFRRDIRCRSLFMEILKQEHGITHQLRHMNQFGILAAYIPAFAHISGLMQYDLFHVYTVDQHTLFVLRNLRRFLLPEFKDEFPLCSEVAPLIPKPELLYLAALFHDIAKGRGGDHSTLGAQEARGFCLQHDLSRYDTELVVWLVQNHLLMSSTAQHKDIEDPEIINGFAQQVADKNRLRYLYLLTVADMYGTNPKIWNSWKESLLGELYNQTLRAFARGLENPLDRRERIKEKQSLARKALLDSGIPADAIEQLWQQTADDYFLRYKDEEIQFHTKTILSFREKHPSDPLVLLREIGDSGTSDIFINATVQRFMFYRITATLDRLNLNIMEARIVSGSRGFTMDTYSVTESDNSPITDPERIKEIESQIFNTLTQDSLPKLITRATTGRQAKHFTIPTDVTFTQDERNHRTIMEITATDRPGLLSRIAFAMKECEVELQNAKVSTVGAQVEDVFFITDKNGKSLTEQEQLANLRAAIKSQLDSDREPALQSI